MLPRSSDSSGEYGNDKSRQVERIRKKIKELNPLRRARKNWTETDGLNNPNIQGADNGGNAWLDAQLNNNELDTEVKYQARYAKKNSDMGRLYDIDDIPIQGPPNTEYFPSDISLDDITTTAQELMNDDNISICSTIGIMRTYARSRNEKNTPERHRPTSTVTRVSKQDHSPPRWTDRINEPQRNKQRGNYRMHRDIDWHHERYQEEQTEGWETPSKSDDESTFKNNTTKKCKDSNYENLNYRPAHSSRYKERAREVRFDDRDDPQARGIMKSVKMTGAETAIETDIAWKREKGERTELSLAKVGPITTLILTHHVNIHQIGKEANVLVSRQNQTRKLKKNLHISTSPSVK